MLSYKISFLFEVFFFYGIYDIHFYLTSHSRLLFIKKIQLFFLLVVDNTKYTAFHFSGIYFTNLLLKGFR